MLNMSSKCFPFEQMPFSFNPKGHHSNIYEVVNALDFQGREDELLARKVRNNTEQLGILYSAISDLDYDGSLEDINKLDGDGFKIQAYTIWFLPPIYPKKELRDKENAEFLKEETYKAVKELYEKVYGAALTYGE